ncbi:transposase [Mumia flava]|uniref:Transposase n=1 Tax=Mumia flava TaxID=1348852 RepID=A0A2M9BFN5_9ACTN|nr:transposase [Mumia flava]
MPKKFEPEMRERVLRMFAEALPEHQSKSAAARHVSELLGISPETLRTWARRVEVDQGKVPGTPSDVVEENRRLR